MLDENKLRMLHNLMREKGIHNVDISMFGEEQRKKIYESYAEQFFGFNGMGYMVNCVISYALAKNIQRVNEKLHKELEYALKAQDYDYALLCAKLLDDPEMVGFIKNYTKIEKYERVFNDINKFVLGAKK